MQKCTENKSCTGRLWRIYFRAEQFHVLFCFCSFNLKVKPYNKSKLVRSRWLDIGQPPEPHAWSIAHMYANINIKSMYAISIDLAKPSSNPMKNVIWYCESNHRKEIPTTFLDWYLRTVPPFVTAHMFCASRDGSRSSSFLRRVLTYAQALFRG